MLLVVTAPHVATHLHLVMHVANIDVDSMCQVQILWAVLGIPTPVVIVIAKNVAMVVGIVQKMPPQHPLPRRLAPHIPHHPNQANVVLAIVRVRSVKIVSQVITVTKKNASNVQVLLIEPKKPKNQLFVRDTVNVRKESKGMVLVCVNKGILDWIVLRVTTPIVHKVAVGTVSAVALQH